MTATLENLGFDVDGWIDVDQKEMKKLIRDFGARLEKSKGVGLFYYSGHGMEVAGENYMIPIGATIERESDVDMEAVKVGHVLATMEYTRNNVNFVILDACRNNPFAKNFKSATKGLAKMEAPKGTIIAYATAPGKVAIAGERKYSPYTEALAKGIDKPGLPVEMMFKEVARKVHTSTGGRQLPWWSTCLLEPFSFNPTQQAMIPVPPKEEKLPRTIPEELITNSIGMTFVHIPSGTFMMGSPPDEPERYAGEKQYEVTITKPFYMQTTEVTQGQWKRLMGNNPSRFEDCGDDCPVESMSWNDVQNFIEELNQIEDTNKYSLPTEAEWEYACRAGTTGPFNTGNCISTDQANYDGRSRMMPGCPKGEYRGRTVKVGSFPPNAWGLYDMHGNVWEWCQESWLRGGNYHTSAGLCRSANRGVGSPSFSYGYGFRVTRDF
jgi:formylglycine-generating enzyme required for sulfatase activity